ncbi:uncharacterized protein LOC126425221 isoform X4 [Schistocerca serialis cubense]|uniref:uncharacterized protein LOC126425221 isoform X4 n=1 Tax=Schistocerca serialis cubense TaxID=2023355 RepID=UPI00214E4616|nr:uncharacterized protein LOC126425221 isoform X4 [Schistocerca serialis cubense]
MLQASTGEEAAHALSGEIEIKEEPILTDPYQQSLEEIEQIFIKEENIKLEIPEDLEACDPLQLEEEKLPVPPIICNQVPARTAYQLVMQQLKYPV